MDFAKDLSKLGRDLSKILIVDNMESNFILQKENGILIKSYYAKDSKDRSLTELKNILMEIANSKDDDDIRACLANKREIIKKYVS